MLDATYETLLAQIGVIDDGSAWRPTRCAGWTLRDLVFHLLGDARRALVALHTPATGPADVDAVTYWRDWQPQTPGADSGRRGTRLMASVWSSVHPITRTYAETARAVLVAGRQRSGEDLVATQGHVITVDDLLSTLAVEATVHQLDMRLGDPSEPGLAETRRVLDGLLGRPAPIDDATRYALVGTGRERLNDNERELLGVRAGRLPLFG